MYIQHAYCGMGGSTHCSFHTLEYPLIANALSQKGYLCVDHIYELDRITCERLTTTTTGSWKNPALHADVPDTCDGTFTHLIMQPSWDVSLTSEAMIYLYVLSLGLNTALGWPTNPPNLCHIMHMCCAAGTLVLLAVCMARSLPFTMHVVGTYLNTHLSQML